LNTLRYKRAAYPLQRYGSENNGDEVEMKAVKDEFGLYHEPVFDEMLQRERKRTERTQQPFALIMVEIAGLDKSRLKKRIRRLSEVLDECFREIDVQGWFRQNEVIGIICPEVPAKNVSALRKKVENALEESFPVSVHGELDISYVCFPEKGVTETEKENTFSPVYPELKQNTVRKVVSDAAKRVMDITIALIALVILFPVFIIVPILIKLTSPGPVFFRQQRVGFGGKNFTFLKFRSMQVNNDESEHKEFVKNFIKTSSEEQADGTTTFKLVNDKRITPIGRFLRKTSLDELPQLLNVLLGDMSLVGPRPPIPYEVDEYRIWHRRRVMEVRPGITGFWQVHGRSTTTFETMVRMDISYIKSRSLFKDIMLIVKTPLSLFKGAF
jgi:lipopolysaccharide/colanic/teichoic acid biosynthesis glycosyltransferase